MKKQGKECTFGIWIALLQHLLAIVELRGAHGFEDLDVLRKVVVRNIRRVVRAAGHTDHSGDGAVLLGGLQEVRK